MTVTGIYLVNGALPGSRVVTDNGGAWLCVRALGGGGGKEVYYGHL